MKYGLFLLDENNDDASAFSVTTASSVLLSDGSVTQTTPNRKGSSIHSLYDDASSPVLSSFKLNRTPHSATESKFPKYKTTAGNEAIVSPLFDRRRRNTLSSVGNIDKSASTLPRGKVRSWRIYARRSLGVPFPVASSPLSSKPPADSIAYSKGDRYRELAEKANIRLRRSSISAVDNARTTACQAYARPIHKELEETRLFLENLSITPVATTEKSLQSKSEIDTSVAHTLAKVEQMRRDFYQKRNQEKEEKDKAKKLLENQKKQREDDERKQKEAAKNEKSKSETRATLETKKATLTPTILPKSEVSNSTQLHATSTDAAQEWAKKYRKMYRELMDDLAPQIKRNKTKSSYCFRQRGLITRGIGQLKDSWDFICRTANNIKNIIAESAQHGDDVQRWMLNIVAKIIVKQAEKEVAVAHHAAFPLAATAVIVMQTHPLLVDMLLIRLVKKCPYVFPEYAAKSPSQSTTEFMRSIGYKYNGDDIESRELYSERMAGMIALFAAILQTNDIGNIPNPLPLKHAWTWLARIVNLPPRAISPLLVQTFLSIAGPAMLTSYGHQMRKILNLISQKWNPAIPINSPGAVAAKSNLSGFLDQFHNTGILNECLGRHIKTH